jgi:hypothetical protein
VRFCQIASGIDQFSKSLDDAVDLDRTKRSCAVLAYAAPATSNVDGEAAPRRHSVRKQGYYFPLPLPFPVPFAFAVATRCVGHDAPASAGRSPCRRCAGSAFWLTVIL